MTSACQLSDVTVLARHIASAAAAATFISHAYSVLRNRTFIVGHVRLLLRE